MRKYLLYLGLVLGGYIFHVIFTEQAEYRAVSRFKSCLAASALRDTVGVTPSAQQCMPELLWSPFERAMLYEPRLYCHVLPELCQGE